MRRLRVSLLIVLAGLPALVMLCLLLAPEGRLACDEPWMNEISPDQSWTLTICRRPPFFAMPGSSSDAPGWIVLRNRDGAIHGVVSLGMMQLVADFAATSSLRWTPEQVAIPGLVEISIGPARGPVSRWLVDRIWRLRAVAGLVASDQMSAQW